MKKDVNNCCKWLRPVIKRALSDVRFNSVHSVPVDGWYRVYIRQTFLTITIDEALAVLSLEFNVFLLWSTATKGLFIKKKEATI